MTHFIAAACLFVSTLPAHQQAAKPQVVRTLTLGEFSTLVWASDGKSLAIQTDRYEAAAPGQPANWEDGRVKVSAVKIIDVQTGQVRAAFPAVKDRLIRLQSAASGGKSVVVLGFDIGKVGGTLEWWDHDQAKPRQSVTLEQTKGSRAFSPDGKMVAGALSDGAKKRPRWKVGLWDVKTGKSQRTFGDFPFEPQMCFSPDNKALAIGHPSNNRAPVELYDPATGKARTTLAKATFSGSMRLVFSPDGKTLLAAAGAGGVHRWDVKSGKLLAAIKGNKLRTFTAEYSHDGSLILCVGWGEAQPKGGPNRWEAKVIDAKTGAVVQTHADTTPGCSFVPARNAWAVHSRKGEVAIWEVR